MSTRTHVILPDDVLSQIDRLVGKRGRSRFLAEAAETELMRRRQLAALDMAEGAWASEPHPELDAGINAYVRRLRDESEQRLVRQFKAR